MLVERKKILLVFIYVSFLKQLVKRCLYALNSFKYVGQIFPWSLLTWGYDQIAFPLIPRMGFSTWLGTPSFLSLA